MEQVQAPLTRNDAPGNGSSDPQSVSLSLEHLLDGAQGVIAKRIELALLEGQELLSNSIERAALAAAGMVLAATAWLAGAGALVLFVIPQTNPAICLAVFALLNAGAALGLLVLTMRHGRRLTPEPLPTAG